MTASPRRSTRSKGILPQAAEKASHCPAVAAPGFSARGPNKRPPRRLILVDGRESECRRVLLMGATPSLNRLAEWFTSLPPPSLVPLPATDEEWVQQTASGEVSP